MTTEQLKEGNKVTAHISKLEQEKDNFIQDLNCLESRYNFDDALILLHTVHSEHKIHIPCSVAKNYFNDEIQNKIKEIDEQKEIFKNI